MVGFVGFGGAVNVGWLWKFDAGGGLVLDYRGENTLEVSYLINS